MTTTFKSLPIIDLGPLCKTEPDAQALKSLSEELHDIFVTVGFAYLVNVPLSLSHSDIFGIAQAFFGIDDDVKMNLAKKTFCKQNENTYRGYFPAQAGSDNLKEGFEIGPTVPVPAPTIPSHSPFVLTEANVFPPAPSFPHHDQIENLYKELQSLSSTLLILLAKSLGKDLSDVAALLSNSISTLRLLHYPSIAASEPQQEPTSNCTPHTDSGLLTLLHQDSIGGLEVLNSAGDWIPAPHIPGSVVLNIGDLMAQMSNGKFVATYHRVRSTGPERYSVPFFLEPGVDALVGEEACQIRYEEFMLKKMGTWVEYQDPENDGPVLDVQNAAEVEVGA